MTEERDFKKYCNSFSENKSDCETCTSTIVCSKKFCNKYNLNDLILFGEEKELSKYVRDEFLVPYDEENKFKKIIKYKLLKCFYRENTDKKECKTIERLKLQQEQLNLKDDVRYIGIARCNQMIGMYENQHLLTMLAIILTVLGLVIDAVYNVIATNDILSDFLFFYLFILTILLGIQTIKYFIYTRNIKPIYFLKTLLEQGFTNFKSN